MLTSANALEIFKDYDIIADGTDNFPTRYLVNDACVLTGKPNAYGSIFRFEGQASVFATEDGPCYRCLYPEPPPPGLVPSCAEGGVLGILPGLVGVIQATEVIKLILGIGEPLIGRLLLVDALNMNFRHAEAAQEPRLPGLRHTSHRHRAHRLRAVLRHPEADQRRPAGGRAGQGSADAPWSTAFRRSRVRSSSAASTPAKNLRARRARAARSADRQHWRASHSTRRSARPRRRAGRAEGPRDRRPLQDPADAARRPR